MLIDYPREVYPPSISNVNELCEINGEVLQEVSLEEEVCHFLGIGAWHQLFQITNMDSREPSPEALATFEL